MTSKKRSMEELVNVVYEFIEQNGGEIYQSQLRKVISNPKTVLSLIKNIQERPYIYFKKYPQNPKPGQKQFTILKLSSHKRNPNTRYLQIEEIIDYLERQYERIHREKTITKAEVISVLTRLMEALKMMSNRVRIPNSYFI